MKKIVFQKTGSKLDLVRFFDGEKSVAEITNPAQGILPHDFIHALVEKHFKIRGFTDLIFEGQSERGMKVENPAWLSEAMVESLQGMLWSQNLELAQFNEWISSICLQRNVPAFTASASQFLSLVKTIQDYSEKWRALPEHGIIEIDWS